VYNQLQNQHMHGLHNTETRSSATAETTRVGGYYAIQGHSRSWFWYQSKAHMRLPIN